MSDLRPIPVSPPPGTSRRSQAAARNALCHLPGPMLAALISGLEHHRDELAPGRVFRPRTGRYCATGAMLEQLRPSLFCGSGPRFAWWHIRRNRSVGGYDPRYAVPGLGTLEVVFDRAASAARDETRCSLAHGACLSGIWLRSLAEDELGRRHDLVVDPAVATTPIGVDAAAVA